VQALRFKAALARHRHKLSQAKRSGNGKFVEWQDARTSHMQVGAGGEQMPVAKRILILGPSGAGKSTLARRVGARLGLRVVHLDTFHWNPGWIEGEASRFRELLAEAVAGDAWVIDGNYTSHLDLRLPRTQAVIWLDLPRYVYFPRAVWRSIRNYGRERDDLGPGCHEQLDLSFLTDWVWNYKTRSRAHHAQLMASLPTAIRGIILRSPRAVKQFEGNLPRSLEPA
jgi:adenylate kinase family enzyme